MTVDAQKLTFFEKKQTVCPVCDAKFYREELLSGGGRLIAGELTEELRRRYEPSKKFGEVHPLVYPVTVCPTCYFAAYPQDFGKLPDNGRKLAEAISSLLYQLCVCHPDPVIVSLSIRDSSPSAWSAPGDQPGISKRFHVDHPRQVPPSALYPRSVPVSAG